jgi:hypothetical protein
MNYDEIQAKIKNGDYSNKDPYVSRVTFLETHIFDEEQSVRWNREEVARKNAENKEQREAWRKKDQALQDQFLKDSIEYMIAEGFTEKVAIAIYNQSWDDGHSDGLYEVLNKIEKYMEFAKIILGKN